MREGVGGSEKAFQPNEKKRFPVSKEAVRRGLDAISKDPDRTYLEETMILQAENPHLSNGLTTIVAAFEVDRGPFSEGVVFTHRILREQASLSHQELPIVTNDSFRAHLQNQVEESHASMPDMSIGEHIGQQIKDIREQDSEFGKAIDELAKYRASRTSFYAGIVHTYLPLKNTADGEAMNKLFNENE